MRDWTLVGAPKSSLIDNIIEFEVWLVNCNEITFLATSTTIVANIASVSAVKACELPATGAFTGLDWETLTYYADYVWESRVVTCI